MTSAAERMRRMRERAANGRAVLAVDVNLDRLVLALVDDGFLKAWDDNDRPTVEAAVARMIEAYTVDVERRDSEP